MGPVAVVDAGIGHALVPQVQRGQHHMRRVQGVDEIGRETVALLHRVRPQPGQVLEVARVRQQRDPGRVLGQNFGRVPASCMHLVSLQNKLLIILKKNLGNFDCLHFSSKPGRLLVQEELSTVRVDITERPK